jgi:putative transposase
MTMPELPHHPPHIYLDDTWYFITGSIFKRYRILRPQRNKDFVRDKLHALTVKFDLKLAAWVILDNHYHILVKSHIGSALSRFFGQLHGSTSFELNGRDEQRGLQVWHNYWDTCIRTAADFWTHFNYIHYNPVKHVYVPETAP